MRLLYLYSDSDSEWNCSEWRAKIPSDGLNAEHEAGRSPHTAQLIYLPSALDFNHPKVQQIFGRADAIIFQRNVLLPDVWAAMDYWRALGKIITCDLDDAYPSLPPSNPAHPFWLLNKGGLPIEPIDGLCEAMKHCDALVSPSKVLLKDYDHIVPTFHIPNYPRRKWYAQANPKKSGSPDVEFGYGEVEVEGRKEIALQGRYREGSEGWIVLGWGGSISHVDSWVYSGAIEALERIFNDPKYESVRLKFCGHEARLNFLLDRFGDKVIRQQGVKAEHWPHVVSSFDIGLAPLDMRPVTSNTGKEGEVKWEGGEYSYDERRSWLKGVEYLCAGVPWIGTKCETYIDLQRHGVLVENGAENWYKALVDMIDNIGSRKRLAQEKKLWALKKWTMESNINQYVEVYERIGNLKRARGGTILPGITWNRVDEEVKETFAVPPRSD